MNRFLKKICTGILCGVLGVVSIGAQEAFAADVKEMRAVWISTVYSADYPSTTNNAEAQKNEFIQKLEQAQALGLNTVVVQVRPKGDALYQSELNPWSAVLTGAQGTNPGYDPMAFMIAEAHKRGMEFHAWMNPYRITTSGTDVSALSADNMARKHPDWILTYNGAMYYDPANEEVQQYICDTVKEVVEKYDVDAIHFDDYFYPDKKIDLHSYEKYKKDGGILSLEEYRLENITTLIRNVYEMIKVTKENVKFGIAPEGNIQNDYENSYLDVKKILASKGYVDYIMPQIYFGFENQTRPFKETLDEWNNMIKDESIKIIPALAFYKIGTTDKYALSGKNEWIENSDIIKRQILYSRSASNYNGFSLFRYDYIFNENKHNDNTKKEIIFVKEIINND